RTLSGAGVERVRAVTRDEILALEDRELDAAVAERVMGWLGRPKRFAGTPIMLAPVGEGKFTPTPVPAYSADIAAAWQVVERMREMGLRPIIVPDWNEQWL